MTAEAIAAALQPLPSHWDLPHVKQIPGESGKVLGVVVFLLLQKIVVLLKLTQRTVHFPLHV